jgi:transmembrane secretion effector
MQLLRPAITTPSVQRRTDGKRGAAIELSGYPVWVVGMAKRAKGAIRVEELQSRNDSAMSGSAWGPLREPIFRALWKASVASNVGSWMQDVGESWLMISLTRSSILVALVEYVDC